MATTVPGFQVHPNTCGVMDLLQNGGAFISSIIQDVVVMQASLQTAAASLLALPNVIQGIALADVQILANNLLNIASGAVATLISHLEAHLTNLIDNLSLAIGQAGAQAGLSNVGCGLPGLPPNSGPCGSMQSLFGSIMGLAGTLASQITGLIGNITNSVGGLGVPGLSDITGALNSITGAVADVAAIATQITAMVESEVAALATATANMLTFTAANALFELIGNPCAQQVLSAVGSPALLAHLTAPTPPPWSSDPIPPEQNISGFVNPVGGVTSNSVSLSWQQPQVGDNLSYQPQFAPTGTNNWANFGSAISSPAVTVTGLTGNTTYDFRVITTSQGRYIATSEPITITTEASLSGNLEAVVLTVTNVTSTSASLSWTTPSGNGPFLFQPQYRVVGSTAWVTFGIPISTNSITVTGLSPNQSYEFSVENIAEAPSNIVSATTPGTTAVAPANPGTLTLTTVTTTSIGFSWNPPATGTPPFSYLVQYRLHTTDQFADFGSRISTATATIAGLLANNTYDFQVTAFNDVGQILYPILTAETIIRSPGPAINIRTSASTANSVTLSWDAPTSGTPPFNYQVQFRPQNTGSFMLFGIPGATNTATVSGLNPGVAYDFQVITNNQVGRSTSSIFTTTTSTQNTISPPLGLQTSNVTATTVSLSWLPPSSGSGPFSYQVEFSLHGVNAFQAFGSPTTSVSETVTGLQPQTSYDFQVRASNVGGTSAPSSTTIATTLSGSGGILPGAVNSLQIGLVTTNSIALSWARPSAGDQPFTYQPQFKPTASTIWNDFGSPLTVTSTTVTGLAQNTSYDFRVYAINSAGRGPASTTGTAQTSFLTVSTWNSADKSPTVALSNNNLTATTTASIAQSARST